ncbi:hypothetical protein D3C73_1565290 [compost metagenome]
MGKKSMNAFGSILYGQCCYQLFGNGIPITVQHLNPGDVGLITVPSAARIQDGHKFGKPAPFLPEHCFEGGDFMVIIPGYP